MQESRLLRSLNPHSGTHPVGVETHIVLQNLTGRASWCAKTHILMRYNAPDVTVYTLSGVQCSDDARPWPKTRILMRYNALDVTVYMLSGVQCSDDAAPGLTWSSLASLSHPARHPASLPEPSAAHPWPGSGCCGAPNTLIPTLTHQATLRRRRGCCAPARPRGACQRPQP